MQNRDWRDRVIEILRRLDAGSITIMDAEDEIGLIVTTERQAVIDYIKNSVNFNEDGDMYYVPLNVLEAARKGELN